MKWLIVSVAFAALIGNPSFADGKKSTELSECERAFHREYTRHAGAIKEIGTRSKITRDLYFYVDGKYQGEIFSFRTYTTPCEVVYSYLKEGVVSHPAYPGYAGEFTELER